MVDSKTCRACGQTKPVEDFPVRRMQCKPCVADYQRAYYQANRDALRAKQNEYSRQQYAENREAVLGRQQRYRDENREAILAKKRAYYSANRARLLAEMKAYQSANADRYRDNVRAWRAANPDKASAFARARRVRKLNAPGSHTEADWRRMLRIWNWSCAYCGKQGALTRDHVIPLSRGGSDFIGNIVPACANCNSSKNARVVVEWKAAR